MVAIKWLGVLPVDVLRDEAQVGQQLVEHPAVVEENEVKHQTQGGGGDDDGEKVQGPEQLGPHPDGVHQQRQNEGNAHLEDHSADGEKHRVAQGCAQLGIGEEGNIVGVPGGIEAAGRGPQAGDVGKAVDDILNKRVVQKKDQKEEGRNQKDHQRSLPLVEGRACVHVRSLPCPLKIDGVF